MNTRRSPLRSNHRHRLTALATILLATTLCSGTPAFEIFKKKKPPVAVEPEKTDIETIVRAQIYLDENLFTPGKIDGGLGEFTRKAVAHYNTHQGIQPLSNWHYINERAKLRIPNAFTTYTLTENDLKFIDPSLPYEFPKQAERKYLYYRRPIEFIAERFHTYEKFLKEINPGLHVKALRPGSTIKVPNVAPFKIEDIPKALHYEKDPVLSARHIVVDTFYKIAAIWEPETQQLIASFPITPGQEKFIHRGDWKLNNMVTTPTFRYDKSMLEQGKRSEEYHQLPPGPNSPVGMIWCGTSKSGIGLHGTSSPDSIGRAQSAGCIRLSNWDAVRLPTLIRPGAKVTIR